VRKLYEVHTFQRSGSHAIYNWLFSQLDEPVLFFNNAKPHLDPVTEMRNPDSGVRNVVDLMPYWRDRDRRDEVKSLPNKVLVVGFEDRVIDEPYLVPTSALHWINATRVWRIVILRDVYNWAASRKEKGLEVSRKKLDLWKAYAKGISSYQVFISFNDWFKFSLYRASILHQLDIEQRSDDISFIPKSGGGSSFDARKFQGVAGQMEVLERWRKLNGYTRDLISSDDELIQINKDLFRMEYPW
jgi:hypothetical protein